MGSKKSIDINFEVGGLTLAAQEWGMPGDFPVMALHGWLDNSGSFDRLAPLLKNIHLIALDCAGHGLSSHRAAGSPYHIWQDVGEVFDIADQLGWQQFGLMGHSRGAIVSTLAAGTFPERITHLGLIDGFRPGTTPAQEAPQQLAKSIVETKRNRRGFALYPDEERAVTVRQHSEIAMSAEAARMLVARGLMQVDGGYTWRSDPMLKVASGFRLTDEQSEAFVDRITARMQLIIAEDGIPRLKEGLERAATRYPHIDVKRLPGQHHLHMEEQASDIASYFNDFFR